MYIAALILAVNILQSTVAAQKRLSYPTPQGSLHKVHREGKMIYETISLIISSVEVKVAGQAQCAHGL